MHTYTYDVQLWDGDQRHGDDFKDLSLDAARHIGRINAHFGYTVRLIAQSIDYTEVYRPDGSILTGTIAETTLVRNQTS